MHRSNRFPNGSLNGGLDNPGVARPSLMTILATSSKTQGDNDLLAAVATGDPLALETLYLKYHCRLGHFVSRFTSRYENIEEIINDTFIVVWQRAKDFCSASRVSTWIFGIAYRTALNSLRRQKNHDAAQTLDDCPQQTIDPFHETEVQDWLAHGLNRLPIEQRLTVELAYRMGYSMEEIAAITNSPVGTVKARMFHARAKLRQYLPALAGFAESAERSD
jgi:RNA polymerase sigma-70 factor, ECF subfamily